MAQKIKNAPNSNNFQEQDFKSITISVKPSEIKFNFLIEQLKKLAQKSIQNPQNVKSFEQLLEKLQNQHESQLLRRSNSKQQKNNSLLKESQLTQLALLSKHSRSSQENQLTQIIVQNQIKQLKLKQTEKDEKRHFKRQKSPHKLMVHKSQEEQQAQIIITNQFNRQSMSKGKYDKFQPGLLAKNYKTNKK